jgi:DNA repair protein RecN (Recombination protein N)
MLNRLEVQNYALIESLEFQPDARLNIITGETGAGKSILLGALGLLRGNRADTKAQLDPDKKCVIEGSFDIREYGLEVFFQENDLDYEPLCIIRREIAQGGKSRAFVNDTPVTLDVLKLLAEKLIDIHSQHDTILLGDSVYQLSFLDAYASSNNERQEYVRAYQAYREVDSALRQLESDASALKKEFDYNSFLLEELVEAKLRKGEQEESEETLRILENAEEVKQRLNRVSEILNHPEMSVIAAVQEAVVSLNPVTKYGQAYTEIKDRLQSVQIELADIADEVTALDDKVELDPDQIQVLKDRLDLLFRLHQKHGTQDAQELIAIKEELGRKVENVLNLEESLAKLQKEKEEAHKILLTCGIALTQKRKAATASLCQRVESLIRELGIPNAAFEVSVETKEPAADGQDKVDFLFSANKGFALQGLKKVASGGEFSRLMLVLKYILAENKALPTLIFDEIDTGVSGEVAVKIGTMMRQMSEHMQLLVITHLHQIAGKGTSHFFVYKADTAERTVSSLKKLEEDERILEIAKMIGGDNPSESSIRSAMELMQMV